MDIKEYILVGHIEDLRFFVRHLRDMKAVLIKDMPIGELSEAQDCIIRFIPKLKIRLKKLELKEKSAEYPTEQQPIPDE